MMVKTLLTKISFSNFGTIGAVSSFAILLSLSLSLSLILPLEARASDWTIWQPPTVYYDFDGVDHTTYVKDRVGNNDLTLTAMQGASAYIQNAEAFFYGAQYGIANDSAAFSQTGSFSVEVWVRFNSLSSDQTVLAKWDETSDDRSYRIMVQADGTGRYFPKFQVSPDGTAASIKTVTGKTQILPGIKYLLQGYYDAGAGAIYIYVNGVREGSTGSVGSSITDEPSNFYLGATKVGSSTFNYFLNGTIDEFRLFSGTRSEGSFAYSKRRGEPVAKISFDDAGGVQAFDNSYYDNRGALVNFPTNNSQWQPGFYNYALQFDGTNDYVDLGSKNSLQLGKAITISTWIYLSSLGNYTIVSQPHTNGYTFSLTSAGEMTFGALGGTTVTSSGAGISANDWTHIAVTYDGSRVYFYKDGRVISVGSLPLWSVSTGGVFVGRAGSTPNYFQGKMDNLLIYPYNRTLFEIYTDLNQGAIVLGRRQELRPANAEKACPSGYVWVSGDPLFGTNDFCVMKYEAKYDADGDGTGDDAPDSCKYNTSYDTWDWNDDVDEGAGACPYSFSSANVVSTPEGSPIAGIKHSEAVNVCPSGTHLITNAEWMTIARNAASMASNWADNDIGSTVASSGGLKRGNVGITDSVSYNGADPEKGTGRNSKAKLTLSNGQEIWDISGNVWEHVNFDADGDGVYGDGVSSETEDLISEQDQPEATDGASTRTGWGWSGFNSSDPVSTWYLENNGSGPLNYDVFRPFYSDWDANEGVGRIYHNSNSSSITKNRVFLRGGYWSDGADAGAFTLYLIWGTGDQNYPVGLRCAR